MLLLLAACSAGESTEPVGSIESASEEGSAQPETSSVEAVEECDPSVPHPKGAFEFDPQLDASLPESWRTEFAVIMANLQTVAPISPCLHDFTDDYTGENSGSRPAEWCNFPSPWGSVVLV